MHLCNDPLVSVLMPVYNAESYLRGALESILCQTFSDLEIVVVNDGSTDHSLEILKMFGAADARIRIISRDNTGIVGALNDGLDAARGSFIARMDADDIAHPGRIALQIDHMRAHTDIVALGTAVLFIDPEGRPIKTYRPQLSHKDIEADLSWGNGGALVHPTVVFRRDALSQSGGYRQRYNFIEDLDLFIRIAEFGKLGNLNEALLSYRQHPASVNQVAGDRTQQIAELIAPIRERMGLPRSSEGEMSRLKPNDSSPDAFRRRCAFDAVESGNFHTAHANALLALSTHPFSRKNWSCLHYVMNVSKAGNSACL